VIAPLLALALAARAPAAAAPPPDEKWKAVTARLLKRIPKIVWQTNGLLVGDVNGDRHPDVVALGTDHDNVVLAVVLAPVTLASKPLLITFRPPAGPHPDPGAVCGAPAEVAIGFEPPGVKPTELACAAKKITPECREVLATELRLQTAREHGARGIRMGGGKCLPLHIYFDRGRFRWWRND